MISNFRIRLTSKGQSSHRLCQLSVLAALAVGPTIVYAQSGGLTLDEALRLALQASPSTKAADASVEASRQAAARAGQLPDPVLKVGLDNLPVTGKDKFSTTADFMTMRRIGVEQEWVSADKRLARKERAQRAVEMEEGDYLANVARVREEAAKAWINVLFAQRSLVLFTSIEKAMTDDLEAVQAAHRGAKASASDVLQAQMIRTQAKDTVRKAEQDLMSARIALTRWTFVPVESVADSMPPLASHVPGLPVADLEKYHPMVLTARRAENLANADFTVAVRESKPDWTFEAGFSQRGGQYSNMISVGVSIPLPINRAQKQDRDIAEKSALRTKAKLQYEDALREMQTEIETLSTTLRSLNERAAQLHAQLLPPASEQVQLAAAAYRAGAGSLTAVFNARRMSVERQLQVTDLEKEAALTWARLELHVIPHAMASTRSTSR
jgi:outer membrane protein TolC